MLVESEDLISSTDIAILVGVGHAAVSNWPTRHEDFPKPVAIVGNGRTKLYLLPEIATWWKAHKEGGALAGTAQSKRKRLAELMEEKPT